MVVKRVGCVQQDEIEEIGTMAGVLGDLRIRWGGFMVAGHDIHVSQTDSLNHGAACIRFDRPRAKTPPISWSRHLAYS